MVSLDGSIKYIGVQFTKLLNTGTSNLATDEYVEIAIFNGGGGGGVNYYDKSETNTLLNNKLNPRHVWDTSHSSCVRHF